MRPFRPMTVVLATVALSLAVVACGSKGSSSSTTTEPVTTTTPAATIPAELQPICTLLGKAVAIDQLQPTNAANWASERQRVVTAATDDAYLYRRAAGIAPEAIAKQLPVVADYADAITAAVKDASSFSAATTAIGAYPDKVGASLAMSTIENWKRTNCRN